MKKALVVKRAHNLLINLFIQYLQTPIPSLKIIYTVWFPKISIPPPQRITGNSFKGMYEPKLEFPEGRRSQTIQPPWGEYGYFLDLHIKQFMFLHVPQQMLLFPS